MSWLRRLAATLALSALLGGCAATGGADPVPPPETLRIALVHLAAEPGETEHNRRQIEAAVAEAIAARADWIVTPELAETGYGFAQKIGTDWIPPFPSPWVRAMAEVARANRVALFLGIAERDAAGGSLHNSVAVIDRDGQIRGTYRKHRVINGPSERWARPGDATPLFAIDGIPVGLLICADAYTPELAAAQQRLGARLLLSPANWAPLGEMGPNGAWEARSAETGLPLIVNNRTGVEPTIDFSASESAVVAAGQRLATFTAARTRVFLVDWNLRQGSFTAPENPAVR